MNTDHNSDGLMKSDGLMYKTTAFAIFVVLVTLIILVTISSASGADDVQPAYDHETTDRSETIPPPDTTAVPVDTTAVQTEAPVTTSPITTASPVTTAPVTTASPVTTAPVTTASVTTAADTTPVEVPAGNTPEDIAEFLADYPSTVLSETEDAGQEYIDKIIFLGDSTTYGLRAYKMLSGGKETLQVWTPVSGTLTLNQQSFIKIWYPDTGTEISIKEAVEAKKPEYLVITLGVNGVSFMGEDWFKSEYKSLIETVQAASPDTKIICQSIFPVAKSYESLKSINNEKIDTANRWIVQVADECGVKYVDTNSVLRDEEGWLPEAYHNGDGLHLQTNSFTLVLNNLRTHAWVELDKDTKGN
ncbi:MAG: hypothetical protein IJ493_03955 [Clostridia bacterium]|nr:hypothetical protein [Clostridia bacterium]